MIKKLILAITLLAAVCQAQTITRTGQVVALPGSNGVDIFSATRKTDTSPTGNFINLKSAAGASLFSVDINGNATVPNVTAPQFNKKVYLDGTTNTTVQATINAAAALGCAEAHIPAGTYTLDSTVLAGGNTIPSCVSLVGDGADKTILVYKNTAGAGAGYDPIENSSLSGGNNTIVVSNLTIDASQLTSGTSRCIYFKNVTKFWVEHVHLTGCQTHGFMADDGTNTGWVDHNTVEHIVVGTGFEIGNTPTSAVVNNIWVTDNVINDTGANGVFSIGSKVASAYGNSGIHADRNTCTGVKDTCVEIGASSQNSTANGNTCTITTATSATCIGIRATQNVTATGNVIDCGSQTGAVGIIIWSQGTDNTISRSNGAVGNAIQNCPIAVKTTGNSAQIDEITIKNNQYRNNVTNYSPAGTETHLHYCSNSDNLCDINDGYTIDEGPIVASTFGSQLKLQAIQGGQVGIVFRENDVSLPNGLWRIQTNGDAINFSKNTAVAGDFSTNFNFLSIGTGSTGTVTIPQGLFTAQQGLKVGANGNSINTVLNGTGTLTFTAIAAQTGQEQTLAIANASTSNFGVACSPKATLGNVNLAWSAWVSASGTVSVRVVNPTAGSITPSAVSWGCTVFQ